MKITTNKDNWSGEEITVNVNQSKKSFSLYGYDFKLEVKADFSKDPDFPAILYNIVSPAWEYPLGVVAHDINIPDNEFRNEYFEAWAEEMKEGNLSRTGNNIYEAAIKMLCNII